MTTPQNHPQFASWPMPQQGEGDTQTQAIAPGGMVPPGQPKPERVKEKRFGWLALILVFVLGCAIGFAIGSQPVEQESGAFSQSTGYHSSEPTTPEPGQDASRSTAEERPTRYTPKASDWDLKIKVRDKQCFGSAGCNMTVRVTPKFVGDGSTVPDEGTISLTYHLTGDESGTITGTLDVDCATTESDVGEEYISTRSSGTQPKAKITDLEWSE